MATAKLVPDLGETAVQQLEEEILALEGRLRDGEVIVRQEKERGGDRERVAFLEGHWIRLLRNYELKFDRLQRQLAVRRENE